MYIFKIIKTFILSLLAATLVVSLSTVVFFGSDSGKQKLKEGLNYYLNFEGIEYEIGSVNSFLPFSISMEKIHFTHNENPWLIIKQANLIVGISQLLFHKKLNGKLEIESVEFINTPPLPESSDTSFDPLSFFENKKFGLPLDLDLDIQFREVLIGEKVTNRKLKLKPKKFHTSYSHKANTLESQIELDVGPIGQKPTTLILSIGGRLDNLEIDLNISNNAFQIANEPPKFLNCATHISGFPFNIKGKTQLNLGQGEISLTALIPLFTFQNNSLKIPKVSLKSLGISVDGNFSYNLNSLELKSKLQGSFKDLRELSKLINTDIEGKGGLNALISFSNNKLYMTSNLNVEKFRYDDTAIGNVHGNLMFSGDIKSPTVKSKLSLKNIKNSVVSFDTLNSECRLKGGQGSFSVKGKGEKSNINILANLSLAQKVQSIDLKKLQLNLDKLNVNLRKPVQISRKDKSARLSPASLNIMGNRFTLGGEINNEKLNFKLDGVLNLEPLSRLFIYNDDVIRGKLQINLEALGDIDKPNLNGRISLSNGYYENSEYGTILDKLALAAELRGDEVKVTSFSATDKEKGRLTLSGKYHLNTRKLDSKLEVKNFQLTRINNLNLLIDKALINLQGEYKDYICSGDVYLGSSTYDLDQELVADIKTLNTSPEKQTSPESEPQNFFMDQLRFNVTVHILKSFLIKKKGLNSRWRGQVKLLTADSNPLLEGNLRLIKGELKFIGSLLKIEEGKIVFDRDPNNIPFINLMASTTKNDIKAGVQVIGRLTKPKIELTSSPPLPRDEILSHLLFGKDSYTLSPFEAIQFAKSLSTLDSLGDASGLSETLADSLGLDKLGIGETESGEAALKIEKRLFDRVTVELSQGVGTEGTSAIVEIELTPRVSLKSKIGAETNSQGLSLNYKYDY